MRRWEDKINADSLKVWRSSSRRFLPLFPPRAERVRFRPSTYLILQGLLHSVASHATFFPNRPLMTRFCFSFSFSGRMTLQWLPFFFFCLEHGVFQFYTLFFLNQYYIHLCSSSAAAPSILSGDCRVLYLK